MPDTTTTSRRSEQSRRAILDAAQELCTEVGYDRLRIEAIARRAGTGKQTIYRWWSSKGDLLLDAVLHGTGASDVFPDTGDLVDDMGTQMLSVMRVMSSEALGATFWAVLAAAHDDPELGARFRTTFIDRRRQLAADRLRRGVQDGQLASDTDVPLLIDQLYGAPYYRFVVTREPVDEPFVREHARTVLGAYRCVAERWVAER